MSVIITEYHVTLRKANELVLCDDECNSYYDVSKVVVAWFRERMPVGECLILIGLNARNKIIGLTEISRGGLSCAAVYPSDIFRTVFAMAAELGASAFILAHNHPSEDVRPSPEDIAMTDKVFGLSLEIGTPLLDDIIVAIRSGETSSIIGAADIKRKINEAFEK